METIEKILDDIRTLVQSQDLSDSLHLRQLHKKGMAIFAELNSNLERCRAMVQNGQVQEARVFNCSFAVSLTAAAERLDEKFIREFFDVCGDYGLEKPLWPDQKLLNTLSVPSSHTEKRLHELLQEYRKIARTATKKERIDILRQIVNKLPESIRWRNDLIAAERARISEIEKRLDDLPDNRTALPELEELYRELLSPDWINMPKGDLMESVRQKLLPLQQEFLREKAEEKLSELDMAYAERDLDALRTGLENWRKFCTNPLLKLTSEQKLSVADIEKFLQTSEEQEKGRKEHLLLVEKLEELLASNCTFAEVAGDYNQLLLQLDEYPVSPSLLERLKNLEQENRRGEHLRNVRRCVYGFAISVFTISIIAVLIIQVQKYLAVKQNCKNLSLLIEQEKYLDAANLYVSLRSSSPVIAANAKVLALYNSAIRMHEQKKAEQKSREEEFARLLKQIEHFASGNDVLDNARTVDKSMAEAKAIIKGQPKKAQDSFRELETKIAEKRTEIKKKREQEFLSYCRKVILDSEKTLLTISDADLKMLALHMEKTERELKQKMELFPYVPEHLKKRVLADWANFLNRFRDAAIREERRRLVKKPYDFETYLKGLEEIRYKDASLAVEFRNAIPKMGEWRQVYETYLGNVPESADGIGDMSTFKDGILKNDLAPLLAGTAASREFRAFFGNLLKLKNFYELRFSSLDGQDYFFYTSEKPLCERLRRPVRTHISFPSLKKDGFFVFRYEAGAKERAYSLLEYPQAENYTLPAVYAQLAGKKSFAKESVETKCAAGVFAEKYGVLGADGPGLFLNLQRALLDLKNPENILNVYLKEEVFIAFLEEFCRIAPAGFYPEAEKILQQFKDMRSSRTPRSWQAAYAHREYKEDKQLLLEMWAKADFEAAFDAGKIRRDFVCAFHARKLVPAGIVQGQKNGKIQFHPFSVKAAEYYIIYDEKLLDVTSVIRGHFSDKKYGGKLFTGQVLWTFGDERKTRDFIHEWKKKALEKNMILDGKMRLLPDGISRL